MEFGKRHDTTDTTDFCPRQLVTDSGETGIKGFGIYCTELYAWGGCVHAWCRPCSGNTLVSINVVVLHWERLLLGWVTVF